MTTISAGARRRADTGPRGLRAPALRRRRPGLAATRHRRTGGPLHFAGQVFSVVLLGLVAVAAAALVVVPKLTGSVPLTVLSGSMAPTYQAGAMVIVRPTPADELQIGDAITFQERSGDPRVVTHRIVSIGFASDGTREFVTQGDANDAVDENPIREVQVRGKVWYSVPFAGHVATAVSPATRQTAVNVTAGGLVAYGAWVLVTGALARRRPRTEVPVP